jgi:hypothetical protein
MQAHQIFVEKNKDWGELQEWMHDKLVKLFPTRRILSFYEVVRVVEEIGRNYGKYNERACGKLKAELLSVEAKKAGRVRLTEFYKKGLKGIFEFDEKIEYLRALGVLDETDPKQPHVIVPNYISSRANCLSTSSFYVVCCRNECEDVLGALEETIAGEMATPDQILSVVRGLGTQSPTQVNRLKSIAEQHGGRVPLHGRLFAQWMHHAFPTVCPYPHASGAINPQTPDEWMQETGHTDTSLSKDEMIDHINSDTCGAEEPVGAEARKHHHFAENELPWDDSEELLRPKATSAVSTTVPKQGSSFRRVGSFVIVSLSSSLVFFACKYALSKVSKGKSDLPTAMSSFRHSQGVML